MNHLIPFSKQRLATYTNPRDGELKFGEAVAILNTETELKDTPQNYVLIGITEDIGVRANHGIAGTATAWNACLRVLCNMQQNTFTQAQELLILGEVDCRLEMEEAVTLDTNSKSYFNNLGALVSRIDLKVSEVIETVVSAGKIPIIIGGGHNNSFGNLKGLSLAKKQQVNALNFDAHSDFRPLEHRHSGNGFSYAHEEGYLDHYFIYGLHKQYTSQTMLDAMAKHKVRNSWFDETHMLKTISKNEVSKEIEAFIYTAPFGLEIDLDAIAGMGSSALSPFGFSVLECLQFVKKHSANKNCGYVHICEGAPNRALHSNQVGKTIAYIVSTVFGN